jgi:hypothetical protein
MKKIILFVLLSLCVLSSDAQITFGIVAGVKNPMQRPIGKDVNRKFYLLWQAGVAADIPLTGRFYLQPQLLVSAKGSRSEAHDLDSTVYWESAVSGKHHMMYLELPLNVLYKHPLGAGKLVVGAGPYIAYGLGGKSNMAITNRISGNIERSEIKIRFKNKTSPGSGYDYYKPLDAGLNFVAGYELGNGLCFNVNYSLGLTNISPSNVTVNGTTYFYNPVRNSYLGITVGLFINRHTRHFFLKSEGRDNVKS